MQPVNSHQGQLHHNEIYTPGAANQNVTDSSAAQYKVNSYNQSANKSPQICGGRFDFEDGGTYCGGWDDGKAHGHGVCTGPKHQGAYAGAWNYGFEISGAYIWPSGSHYEGQWQNGRRHGLGIEQIGRQIYRGEWSKDGHKGRYGVRESTVSTAKYEGTWNLGYQDGYGCETYADGGKYQGQWQEGKRHGYGIRTSAPFGLASHHRRKDVHASLNSLPGGENGFSDKRSGHQEEIRGGFVLTAKSDKVLLRRNSASEKSKKSFLSGLKIRKQRSTGDLEKHGTLTSGSLRSTISTASWLSTGSEQSNMSAKSAHSESNASLMEDEQLDSTVVEVYMGEWKKDKRSGHGVAERSDGLKYEGEWYNNKRHGYGVTTFRDGTFEDGKYKNNILITSQKKRHLFLARSRKFRERITTATNSAQRALKMAMQRSDIAISRTATASAKAQAADTVAEQARLDCERAVQMAREFAPDFKPSVLERFEKLHYREIFKGLFTATNNPSKIETVSGVNSYGTAQQQANLKSNMSQEQEFPVPSTMYSQQLPVTPQTDLSSQVNQQSFYGSETQIYPQRVSHQVNPSYNFQQQQVPAIGTNIVRNNLRSNDSDNKNLVQGVGSDSNTLQTTINANDIQQQQRQFSQQQFAQTSPIRNLTTTDRLSQQRNVDTSLRDKNTLQTSMNANDFQHQPRQFSQQQFPQQQFSPQQLSQQQYSQQQLSQQQYFQQQLLQQQYSPEQLAPQQYSQQQLSPQQYSQQQLSQQQYSQASPNRNLTSTDRLSQQRNVETQMHAGKPPPLGQTKQQSSIDYFDHYKRPPSRDSSVDRYTRAASRLGSSGGISTQKPSVDRAPMTQTNETFRNESVPRSGSATVPPPSTQSTNGNFNSSTSTMRASSKAREPSVFSTSNQPFEDVLLRKRTLGQDIIPSPLQPKRTESLYLPPKPILPLNNAVDSKYSKGGAKLKSAPINATLQRKKSLPDFQELPHATDAMSREEVSALGSARREAVRRQIEINERLKANPFLYLVSPQVKDWFSRQQLMLMVLFVNILLALLFIKTLA